MKRINGYLDLNELDSSAFTKSEYDAHHKWVEINGKKYYFKPSNFPYTELIAYEIAKLLNIKAVKYDLATYNGLEGVISENYHREGCKYTPGFDITVGFYADNKKWITQMGLSDIVIVDEYEEPYISETNNLEVLWPAIEYYYPNAPKADIIKCVYNLVEQLIFAILADLPDKGSQNWEVEEDGNHISLVPLYDNEGAFAFDDHYISMSVSFQDIMLDIQDVLRNYFKISSQEYIDLFIQKYELLKDFGLERIIDIIEKKTQSAVPQKDEYLKNYYANMNKIEEVLNEYQCRRKNG